VGIGGTGMSAVARLLQARGHRVSGSDSGRWPLSEVLRAAGMTVHETFAADHLAGADVVLRSSAYGEGNPEVGAAHERGMVVWKRDDAWRALSEGQRVVAIAGTHGKTTTTAMTWTALRAGGVDASLICGAALRGLGSNAHAGADPVLVIEADEYDRAFLALEPEIAIVTNIDHDHVDVYPSPADYAQAFDAFATKVRGPLITCADDPGSRALAGATVIRYGLAPDADRRITDRTATSAGQAFTLTGAIGGAAPPELAVTLGVPGVHNARNAAGALVAALAAGAEPASVGASLAGFAGTSRRLEVLGEADGVTVVDDYAHHPAEIRGGLEAFAGHGRRIVVFQPHTPSRLSAFFDAFAAELRSAEVAIVVETFSSAREAAEGGTGLGARRLAVAAGASYAPTAEAAAAIAADAARRGDVVIVMGAGDIRPAAERVLALLATRRAD